MTGSDANRPAVPAETDDDAPAGSRDLAFVLALIGLALLILGPLAYLTTFYQPPLPPALPPELAATTTLVEDEISGTATLWLGPPSLDQQLAVFYQPGEEGAVLPTGAVAGTLVGGDWSAALVRVPCPADLRADGAAVVCLDAPALPYASRAYEGTATIVPSWGPAADQKAQTVEVTVVARQSVWLFLIAALLGTLISLWATWFLGDYQQIRRLREACAAVAWDTKYEEVDPPPLKLEPRTSPCAALPRDLWAAHAVWLRSLVGDAPDYTAVQKEIQAGKDLDAAFDELCRVRDMLIDDLDLIHNSAAQLGFSELALSKWLQTLVAPRDTPIPAADVVEMVASWTAVHQTAERWLAATAYIDDLCRAAREIAGQDDSTVCPPPLRASEAGQLAEAHLLTAKQKLAVVTGESSWATLEPEADLRTAWLALNLYRAEMDGMRRQFSLLQQGSDLLQESLSPPESLPDPLDLLASLSDRWRGVGEWISETVAAWSPALNRGLILALFLLSLATTLILGVSQLYVGKPWGTFTDVLFLLLVGTGVHAGLTGLFVALRPKR